MAQQEVTVSVQRRAKKSRQMRSAHFSDDVDADSDFTTSIEHLLALKSLTILTELLTASDFEKLYFSFTVEC